MIPHNRPIIDEEDIKAVSDNLRSGMIADGKTVGVFEKKFREYIGMGGSVAVNSGTDALFMALKAPGIKESEEVIVPTYVCSAVLNSIMYLKAKPVVVDVDEGTFNIDVDKVEAAINKNTKCVIVPHTYGVPAKVDEILKLGVPVIEDCAQAIGAELNSKMCGTFGAASIFSFYATKLLTTGHGGMVLSDNIELIERVRDVTDYDQREKYKVRFNFSMTDFQAALGISQLGKYSNFLKKREEIAAVYDDAIQGHLKKQESHGKRVYYRYVVKVKEPVKWIKEFSDNEIKIINPLERKELLHRYLGLDPKDFPRSEKIVQQTISLPIYPSLKQEEIEKITDTLGKCLERFE